MERASINKAIKLTELFQMENNEMPLMQQRIFLQCCLNEGESVSSIQQKAGQSEAAGSRNLRALSARLSPTRKGYDLVKYINDPNDIRRKNVYLTAKGKKLADKVCEVLGAD